MPELMGTLLDELPDGRMLRVGMTNPPYMLEHLDAIVQLLRHPRCYAFLHIPVQSGSNAVLSAMNREYTIEQFYQVYRVPVDRWSLNHAVTGWWEDLERKVASVFPPLMCQL